jgi:phosphocarrier protein HPr
MVERHITVENALGIHARPATKIIQTAGRYKSEVFLEVDGASADARSIMSVMMLAAPHNAAVTIRARGPDEVEAVDALAALFRSKFDEE